MKVLYHVATDLEGTPLTAVLIDGNGKRWEVPYDEPTEFENVYMADKLIEHCRHYGIVEVTQVKSKGGIQFDVDDAMQRALAALELAEKTCINDYIKVQLESRVKANVPPLPPEGRSLDCVIKHKVNLLKYGLRPIGWDPPYAVEGQSLAETANSGLDVSTRITALEQENEKLRLELRQFMQAVSAGRVGLIKGKGQKPTPATADNEPDSVPQT